MTHVTIVQSTISPGDAQRDDQGKLCLERVITDRLLMEADPRGEARRNPSTSSTGELSPLCLRVTTFTRQIRPGLARSATSATPGPPACPRHADGYRFCARSACRG